MSYCVLVAILVSMATSSYAVSVYGQCDTSADCLTPNTQPNCQRIFTSASCTTGLCFCKTGYTGKKCTVSKLYGQSCTQNSDCGSGLTCISSACRCEILTHTYRSAIAKCVDQTKKVYGEACTQSTECYNGRWGDFNAIMTCATTCQCATGYVHRSGFCYFHPTGMMCSTTCQCATGYVHRSGFCYIPYLGEACAASTGCTSTPMPIDVSRQNVTCTSGTCSCPSSMEQYTIYSLGTSYSYCLATTSATLKVDGATCTLHKECASKYCDDCPADSTRTKRCLRINTSGVSGIQATTGALLTLVALKVTLI